MAAAELVNAATSEKLAEVDWMKNIEICEIVSGDQRLAKEVTKAIKKRLGSKNLNSQLYAVMLLEMLMDNIGEHIHKQVIDTGILPILVKIVKKKSDLPVRERIFLLLDATQTSLGGASGKFPQYYTAYYDLVSAGVQFPQRSSGVVLNMPVNMPAPTSQQNRDLSNGQLLVSERGSVGNQVDPPVLPESSIIIQKASNAAEVLKEVLDAVDRHDLEAVTDEFTLDLVEQCSFQKQRVMHLVMTSRDEKIVSQAIDLNERLQKVLARHDILLSDQSLPLENQYNHASTANLNNSEEVEEEEAKQLFRRLRNGKACAIEEENASSKRIPVSLVGLSIGGERANRPIIRPISISDGTTLELDARNSSPDTLPPPPAKHVEREKFFQHKSADDPAVAGHTRGPSLHCRNTSRSGSGSIEFSE